MAPSAVNNGARALEGIIARWDKDTNGSLDTTGSSSDYIIAANQTISAYYDGFTIAAELNHTNDDTAVTLNVDSVGAGTVLERDGTAPPIGSLVSGAKETFRYDGTNFQLARTPVKQTLSSIATTSGTTRDITGLPALAEEIYISLDVVSTDSANQTLLIQLGDSGGFETSGYSGRLVQPVTTAVSVPNSAGFALTDAVNFDAAATCTGDVTLIHYGSNVWGINGLLTSDSINLVWCATGVKTLSGELTQVRLTTAGGSAAFDLGTMRLRAK